MQSPNRGKPSEQFVHQPNYSPNGNNLPKHSRSKQKTDCQSQCKVKEEGRERDIHFDWDPMVGVGLMLGARNKLTVQDVAHCPFIQIVPVHSS